MLRVHPSVQHWPHSEWHSGPQALSSFFSPSPPSSSFLDMAVQGPIPVFSCSSFSASKNIRSLDQNNGVRANTAWILRGVADDWTQTISNSYRRLEFVISHSASAHVTKTLEQIHKNSEKLTLVWAFCYMPSNCLSTLCVFTQIMLRITLQ